MSKKPSDAPVNVDLGLSAGAHFEVKAEVPPSSVGRFVDALTDLFRPFSESRGLQADQIRMQRGDVAIEIAKRARAALAIENMEVKPVSNKILIPLIEKSSNEDIKDDFMIDQWSSPLASASGSANVEPRFVGILGELQGRQAKALLAIAKNNWGLFKDPAYQLMDAAAYLDAVNVRKFLNKQFLNRRSAPPVNDLYNDLVQNLNVPGGGIVDIIMFDEDEGSWSLDERHRLDLGDLGELDLEILDSLGLIKRVNIYYNSKFKHEFQIVYYHLTELGIEFFLCCNRDIKLSTDAES